MTWEELDGWWTDAGTFESFCVRPTLLQRQGQQNGAIARSEISGECLKCLRPVTLMESIFVTL